MVRTKGPGAQLKMCLEAFLLLALLDAIVIIKEASAGFFWVSNGQKHEIFHGVYIVWRRG